MAAASESLVGVARGEDGFGGSQGHGSRNDVPRSALQPTSLPHPPSRDPSQDSSRNSPRSVSSAASRPLSPSSAPILPHPHNATPPEAVLLSTRRPRRRMPWKGETSMLGNPAAFRDPLGPAPTARNKLAIMGLAGLFLAAFLTGFCLMLVYFLKLNQFPGLPPPCEKNCATFSHAAFSRFLSKFTVEGVREGVNATMVQYHRLHDEGSPDLDLYFHQLKHCNISGLNLTSRHALFMNAHNAFSINMIVKNYCGKVPCHSINRIGNFLNSVWTRPAGMIGGRSFSLENIEKEYLLKEFAPLPGLSGVNAAALSAPDVGREALEENTLLDQLNQRLRTFLANPTKGAVARQDLHAVYVSEAFHWYGLSRAEILTVLQSSAPEPIRTYVEQNPDVALRFLSFNRNLNEAPLQ